jgi:hypothetical protein
MESLKFQVYKARNDLRRKKNEYRKEEQNLKFLVNNEYQINLARNEYLKNKESEERKKIKDNYAKKEREIKENLTIKSNINEFNRFLLDNQQKSEIEKKKSNMKNKSLFKKWKMNIILIFNI